MNNELKQDIKIKFLELLKSKTNGNISEACQITGISRQSVNRWRKVDDEFDKAVMENSINGKENLADIAESALLTKLKEGDTTAIIFTLKTLRREYYGEFKPLPQRDSSASLVSGDKEIAALERILQSFSKDILAESNSLNDEEKETFNSLLEKMSN